MSFMELLRLIQDGESVRAGVANRPTRTLDANVRYIRDLLLAMEAGETVFARDVTVEAGANVGMPVYYNPATQRFERALAATTTDAATGLLVMADSSHVWGVVHAKSNATLADVLLLGYSELDLSAALETGQTLRAGLYHLSTGESGKLAAAKPPLSIPVLRSDGVGHVFVNPQWTDGVLAHSHVHVALVPRPAGTHSSTGLGGHHTITHADADIEGWLPADDAVFAGAAPDGAVFGYNWRKNTTLAAVWPPMPLAQAVLLRDGLQTSPGPGIGGLVILDRNGVWWMSDCYGEVPFPDDIVTDSETISAWSDSSDSSPCVDYRMRLDLYFTRFGFLTEQTVVTGLSSDDPRLAVVCESSGLPARTGALRLLLNLALLLGDINRTGYLALKEFDTATQTFHRGPVASGLYAASGNVALVGEATSTRVLGAVSRTIYHGAVGVTVVSAESRELLAQLVRLDGATEEYTANVMYLGLPDADCGFRARLHVPETLEQTDPQMKLKFRLLGTTAGALPALTLTYRRVPAPTALNDPLSLPTTDTALTLTITATLDSANEYVDVESDAFEIAAGDDVLYTLTRGSDAYTGTIGVLRQAGLVSAGS